MIFLSWMFCAKALLCKDGGIFKGKVWWATLLIQQFAICHHFQFRAIIYKSL